MMSLETRINGKLIGYAHIVNKTEVLMEDKVIANYKVEYFRPENTPSVISFEITYEKEGGAEGLALLIFKKISETLKKQPNKTRG
ncbi:hypothetical protein J4225_02815 [Candidatus Pacearchaeota archaeon]|nr:hypothetical protein [Candidatus Pacearchaeota archaeon]